MRTIVAYLFLFGVAFPGTSATIVEFFPAPLSEGEKSHLLSDDRYEVMEGDTLWSISERHFGSGANWPYLLGVPENEWLRDRVFVDEGGVKVLLHSGEAVVIPGLGCRIAIAILEEDLDIAYERIRIEREAWLEIHKEKEAASAVIGELRVTLELMRKKLTFLMVCFCALAALVVVRFLLGSRK